ncbi:NAC domain-containing protein, partial [Musa troglodytarum]
FLTENTHTQTSLLDSCVVVFPSITLLPFHVACGVDAMHGMQRGKSEGKTSMHAMLLQFLPPEVTADYFYLAAPPAGFPNQCRRASICGLVKPLDGQIKCFSAPRQNVVCPPEIANGTFSIYVTENTLMDLAQTGPQKKDAFVLCRVTKRNGWQVEIEKIEPMGCKESSHSGEIDDIDAWVAELFDPDFGAPSNDFNTPSDDFGTSSNISQADLSSLLPKQEPVDHYLDQSAEGDIDYLLEGDIYNIFQSDNVLWESNGTIDIAFTTESSSPDGNAGKENFTSFGHNDTGIQIRPGRAGPAAELTSSRIRLQVSKMESRGSASVNHTVKIDKEDRHLDLKKSHNTDFSGFDQESAVGKLAVCFHQADAKSNPSSGSNLPCSVASRSLLGARPATDVTLQKSSGALDDASCIRGILRSLGMPVRALPSAGQNCFILSACIIGIAALLICLLLRDARGFLASFSSLWL